MLFQYWITFQQIQLQVSLVRMATVNKRSVQSFFAKQKENKGTFIEEWESFKFDLLSMRKNRSV